MLPSQTGSKREQIEDGLKTGKTKYYQTLFEQSSSGASNSTKMNFSGKKNDKNEKEVYAIFQTPL